MAQEERFFDSQCRLVHKSRWRKGNYDYSRHDEHFTSGLRLHCSVHSLRHSCVERFYYVVLPVVNHITHCITYVCLSVCLSAVVLHNTIISLRSEMVTQRSRSRDPNAWAYIIFLQLQGRQHSRASLLSGFYIFLFNYPRRLCRSAWVGFSSPYVCLSVCLSVYLSVCP